MKVGIRGAKNHSVSRETEDKLEAFERVLRKWSSRINIVSQHSLDDFSRRHLLDSAQLADLAPPDVRIWADLGSGGGLPGLVVAILMAERSPDTRFILVEADQRKAAFLIAAVQATEMERSVRVVPERIEETAPMGADVVSARALAPLDRLLEYSERHIAASGTCLFPKGIKFIADVEAARNQWQFDYEVIPSLTTAGAAIVRIRTPIQRLAEG